jgi:hypothetical protein
MNLFQDDIGLDLSSPNSQLLVTPSSQAAGIGLGQAVDEAPRVQIPEGIGIAPVQPRATASDMRPTPALRPRDPLREEVGRMGGTEKFLTALGEFAAGWQGKPSPLEARVKQQREERALQAQELRGHVDALESGAKIAKTLQGPAKERFVKDYSAQLNAMREGLGDTYSHIAAQPDLLEKFQEYLPFLPEPMKLMLKQNPDAFWKVAGSAEGLKEMEVAKNRYHLGLAGKKATATLTHAAKLDLPADLVNAMRENPSASTFKRIQDALPAGSPAKLNDLQWEAINSTPLNQEMFYNSLGIMSPKDEAAIRLDANKSENKQTKIEWVGRPGGMKQQARIDRDGNVLGYIGEQIPAHAPASTTHVYTGSLVPAVDANGNQIFIQPSPRADTPPRVVGDAFPPERADATKRKEREAEGQRIWQSIDRQITELESIISSTEGKFTSATGIKGLVTRVGETATGAINPDAATPALDAKNRKELLVASLRKTMADSNMSKADKEALETAIGGIESAWGTKGSTLRGLNNLRSFARDKYVKGDTRPAPRIATPKTKAEFDALPSGAIYKDPDDGKQYRKP